jgi:hypothetical protein
MFLTTFVKQNVNFNGVNFLGKETGVRKKPHNMSIDIDILWSPVAWYVSTNMKEKVICRCSGLVN